MNETLENKRKDELQYSIEKFKGLYSRRVIDYMYSLINLESSILKRDILSDEEFEILGNIELFRDIANFNIYYKTINAYKNLASKFRIYNKLEIEYFPYESKEYIYLNIDGNRKLLLDLNKSLFFNNNLNGYSIEYYKTTDDDIQNKFGVYFEEMNDLNTFNSKNDMDVKVYKGIGSRVIRVLTKGDK